MAKQCACCQAMSHHEGHKEHEGYDHSHGEKNIFGIIKIAAGLVLFGIAMFLQGNYELASKIVFFSSYFILGYDILWEMIKNICKGKIFDENFLMGIATIGAIAIGDLKEAAAVMAFFQVGEYLQGLAVARSKRSINSLQAIMPDKANLIDKNEIKVVQPSELKVNDLILVKAGEKLPIDGVISKGQTSLDYSAINGESLPKYVKEHDEVLSGSINLSSTIYVKVSKTYANSTVSKILELVENAGERKSSAEKFITKFAKIYTPIVLGLALVVAILPPLFFSQPWNDWIYRALIFLIISCPCALVISIPLSFFAGIGKCSKDGVLIKGANYLEQLNSIDTFIFDKTGTLTEGKFSISKINCFSDLDADQLLYFAAIGESMSNHPIAKSILQGSNIDLNTIKVTDFIEYPGMGSECKSNGTSIVVGNKKLFQKLNLEIKKEEYEDWSTIVYVAVDGIVLGSILLEDQIKESSIKTIQELQKFGKNTIMLTGDHEGAASKIAALGGIKTYYSQLLPQDKVLKMEEYQKAHPLEKVAFIGDGINDAPILRLSDLGISMGSIGSDAAIEASDIILVNDDLSKILSSMATAKKTRKIILQNIIFALSFKVIIMVLGIFGITNMFMSIFADVGVALLTILNSIRILKK